MNELSYLEKLLDGVGIEWKCLSDVARIKNGKDHKSLGEGKFPVYGSGGIMRYADTYAYNKPSVLIPRKGSLGNLFFIDVPFWTVDTIFYTEIDEAQIHPKYFYYYLTTVGLGEMNQAGGVPSQTQSVLNKLKIPIPCPENRKKSLAIQAEIVRILDAFTAMTAELTAELNLRKKQYKHYRDQLLSFAKMELEWKTLGWVGDVRMCKRILKNQTSDVGDIPFFKIGTFGKAPDAYISRDIFEEYKDRYHYPRVGEVLISASGTIGRAVIFNGEDAYFQDSNIVWLENDESKVLNKYLFYFYQVANWNVSDGGVIKRLYNDNIKKTLIPIPFPSDPKRSLAEQARVVAILDKFDTLTNSVLEGLPREIELRQKQYEYYRNLLLSFPKPDSEVAA
ncbi:restriction endonuclease subunit S [Morganella morganii]|uniref:restriction endonuclease subunit S n=1 Tax=Morganella morganii TaxID=582 RepID=UPI001B1B4D0A|nr:restriction endonuclease subunit S [Vibrio cholerae]EGR0612130.1 restriction endonuclease subunit S [Vibrio cholerae]BEP19246.1 restriction endonuclease subunit S [Morganella morganii subsp. sibonii]HAZ7387869.1 restriction endonuclease subunit S [Escherichia coli]HDU8311275.1 restriction endonuclease subunit S [Morganella morganii subsp. sibonii]